MSSSPLPHPIPLDVGTWQEVYPVLATADVLQNGPPKVFRFSDDESEYDWKSGDFALTTDGHVLRVRVVGENDNVIFSPLAKGEAALEYDGTAAREWFQETEGWQPPAQK